MDTEKHISELKIHSIKNKRGLSVFEFIGSNNQSSYLLMVNTKNAKLFPVIVNHSPEQKQPEFQFEQPDFERLVRK